MSPGHRRILARVVAPLAFLAAATAAVLLARSVLVEPPQPRPSGATPTVQTTVETPPETTAPATTAPATTAEAEPQATYHTVAAGETLAVIAEEYGTTVEAILELNPGIDPVALSIGQRVRVG